MNVVFRYVELLEKVDIVYASDSGVDAETVSAEVKSFKIEVCQ